MPALKDLSKASKDEIVTTLAALLLHDAGAEITGDKINEVISASGNEVEKYWPGMFASLLSKVKIEDLIKSSTAPGAGPSAAAAPAAAGAKPAAGGEKKEEKEDKKKKDEPKEEEVAGAGADLFGGGGGGKY